MSILLIFLILKVNFIKFREMNPSGAPSVIERFTSLVDFCIGLNSLSNAREAALKKVASNPDLAMTEQEKTAVQAISGTFAICDSLGTAVVSRGGFLSWF